MGPEVTGAELSLSPVIAWVGALALLLSFGTNLWNIFSSGPRQSAKKIADIADRHGTLEREVQRLADQIGQMPNAGMMHRLELALARMEGHIDRLDERLKPVTAIAERMQDILIEQGRK